MASSSSFLASARRELRQELGQFGPQRNLGRCCHDRPGAVLAQNRQSGLERRYGLRVGIGRGGMVAGDLEVAHSAGVLSGSDQVLGEDRFRVPTQTL
jgi:hypothetical protein